MSCTISHSTVVVQLYLPIHENLHEVVSQVPDNQAQMKGSVVDGNSVGDSVFRVHDDTSCLARGAQGQHSLDDHLHSPGAEGLEHDLSHLLSVGLQGPQLAGPGAPWGPHAS